MSIELDTERLARSLEDGHDPRGTDIFRGVILGFPKCGLFATAVKMRMEDLGYRSSTVITASDIAYERDFRHVMAVVHDNPENPLVIDPTWGQFLDYVGYDIRYEPLPGTKYFLEYKNQVLTYRMDAHEKAVRKVARAAMHMRQILPDIIREVVPLDADGEREPWNYDSLCDAKDEESLVEVFDPIWNPKNFRYFEGTSVDTNKARNISRAIPESVVISR